MERKVDIEVNNERILCINFLKEYWFLEGNSTILLRNAKPKFIHTTDSTFYFSKVIKTEYSGHHQY